MHVPPVSLLLPTVQELCTKENTVTENFPVKIIETFESKFRRRKHYKCSLVEGVDRNDRSKCFFYAIKEKSNEEIAQVIKNVCWFSYIA